MRTVTVSRSKVQVKKSLARRSDDERWVRDMVTLRQAAHDLAQHRHKPQNTPFDQIARLLDDPSPAVREKAVRDLYEINPDQAATLVNDALRDGSPEERRRIGSALADSGLLYEAINDLMAEDHQNCYSAFSLLFLVAKAGVVEPLSTVIEKHPSLELSLAVIRLLASSGEPEVASTLERLAENTALAPEIRAAAAESISRF
jgi:HEAT repeat protein